MSMYFWFVSLEYELAGVRKKYGSCGTASSWIDLAVVLCDGVRNAYAHLASVPHDARASGRLNVGHRVMSTLPDERRKELLRRATPEARAFQEQSLLTA